MSELELINLTPHPIVVYAPGVGDVLTAAATVAPVRIIARDPGGPARLARTGMPTQIVAGAGEVPIWDVVYHRDLVIGLPPPRPGAAYIVSLPVALAAGDRDDLLVPFHDVRNRSGTVVGCRALARPNIQQIHPAG